MSSKLCLCDEVIRLMKDVGFEPSTIEMVDRSPLFEQLRTKGFEYQRGELVLYFNKILLLGPEPAPKDIRIALNAGQEPNDWLQDMGAGVLPFLKANESVYFGVNQ